MKNSDNLLMVADSDHDANMLYAAGMFVPDPFIYLRLRGRSYVVMSDLEIGRARKQAPHCRVLSLSHYKNKLRREGTKSPGFAHVVSEILHERRVRQVLVPHNFSCGLADELRRRQVKVKPRPGAFFPQREQKSPAEVKKISAALMMAEVGMAEAMQVLRSAKIGKGRKLIYHNVPLTSEKLRSVINTAGWPATPSWLGANKAAILTRQDTGRFAETSQSSLIFSPAPRPPAISAILPAQWCGDVPAKRFANYTIRSFRGKCWRSRRCVRACVVLMCIAQSTSCSSGQVTRPARTRAGCKDFFMAPGTV